MIVTHLLRYFKIDISGEAAYPHSIDIDHTLLKRMQCGTRAHAQPLMFSFHLSLLLVFLHLLQIILYPDESDDCYFPEIIRGHREDFG